MARRVNQEKLLAKIAAAVGKDLEEVKEKAAKGSLYSYEEQVYESQAVYNYFTSRVQPRQGPKEKDADFEKRYNEWRFRTCEECNQEFAYAYSYEGVKFCSLDCLDAALRKIGLKVTRGRDVKRRWNPLYHPAIVPSSAFAILKSSEESADETSDDPSEIDPP